MAARIEWRISDGAYGEFFLSPEPPSNERKKAIIVCTWDWYYYSHRRNIARLLIDRGYEVIVVTRIFDHREKILADGVRLIELPFSRPSLNPFREYQITRGLKKIYKAEQPDLVYHIAFKPVLYGSLAANRLNIPVQVNAIAGMGQLFLGRSFKIRMIRRFVMFQLKRLFRSNQTRLIVQNQTDFDFLKKSLNLPENRIALIKGVGIDLDEFQPVQKCENNSVVVTMVSRLIREKGVIELVEAARELKQKNLDVTIQLVGDPDFDSPEQIAADNLRQWQDEGLVEWVGFRSNIPQVYSQADIACLPSYSEGLPKSLMEACASGLPIVTTDNSGCREVVDDGENGFIVPPRDSKSLAQALEKLIVDADLRTRFGIQSRLKAETEFDEKLILAQTAAVCGLEPAPVD